MAQNITTSVNSLLAKANAEVMTISAEDALELFDKEDHVFVDLRDICEINRSGKIPGAFSCPRGMLEFWIDPASPYHKEVFNQDKTYVFYCAAGWRSALSAQTAKDMGLDPVYHIDGGFSESSASENPIEKQESHYKP